ncbi:DNA gyrase inhibitor SbmC [Klebsiella pneumoniae]|nr:DNA gyrase inhibitor SbmC [Klebsiella pneumoniae]
MCGGLKNERLHAGFHLVGPWDHTVKQGFEQLMMWVENHQVPAREWVAVYYDNPEEVPAEKLRCATAVTVDEDYVIPANSEGVILAAIAGGDYACARARVVDYDFATPWMQFFDSLQQSTTYRIAPQPCFEVYLNDGNHDGYWDIDMYVPVERVAS